MRTIIKRSSLTLTWARVPASHIRVYRLSDAIAGRFIQTFASESHDYICGTGSACGYEWFLLSINLTSCWFSANGTYTRRIAVSGKCWASMKYHFSSDGFFNRIVFFFWHFDDHLLPSSVSPNFSGLSSFRIIYICARGMMSFNAETVR